MTEEEDAAIAKAWPDRWARANSNRPGASKRRNNLRKAWHASEALKQFRVANPNARCGNCAHMGLTPISDKPHCENDSDFYGYQLVDLDNVCVRWEHQQ